MRTALIAGLVTATFLLPAVPAEASAFRGLKPPRSALEAYGLTDRLPRAGWGLKPDALQGGPAIAPRISYYDGRTDVGRLTLGDTDYRFALYRPSGVLLPSSRTGYVGLPHDLVPRSVLSTQVSHRPADGWGLGVAIRQSEYNFTSANLVALSTERHWGSIRGAYTLYAHWLEGSSAGSAHRLQLSYAYGERERNTIGLSYTTGRDVDSIVLPMGAGLADVRDVALSGRHWLSPNWALTYDVSQEQSPLFRRQGLRLGVSRTF